MLDKGGKILSFVEKKREEKAVLDEMADHKTNGGSRVGTTRAGGVREQQGRG